MREKKRERERERERKGERVVRNKDRKKERERILISESQLYLIINISTKYTNDYNLGE